MILLLRLSRPGRCQNREPSTQTPLWRPERVLVPADAEGHRGPAHDRRYEVDPGEAFGAKGDFSPGRWTSSWGKAIAIPRVLKVTQMSSFSPDWRTRASHGSAVDLLEHVSERHFAPVQSCMVDTISVCCPTNINTFPTACPWAFGRVEPWGGAQRPSPSSMRASSMRRFPSSTTGVEIWPWWRAISRAARSA